MRVLITGAGGFVGGHLIRALVLRGHQVFAGALHGAPVGVSTRHPVTWLPLDVTSESSVDDAIRESRPDGVYHLAGQSSVGASFDDVLGTWDVNATGTLRLLQAVGSAARVLFVSSAEVYGSVGEAEQPITESHPIRPTNPYAASKAAAEIAVAQACRSGATDAVIARSFNHTGPGQDERFSIPSFARQLVNLRAIGEPAPVLRVGNLAARRDFLDVRDVVEAYLVLMEEGARGEVYNVCSGRATRMSEIVDLIVEVSGTGARVEVDPVRLRSVDIPLLKGDPAKLKALGWKDEIPLKRTLHDLFHDAADSHAKRPNC